MTQVTGLFSPLKHDREVWSVLRISAVDAARHHGAKVWGRVERRGEAEIARRAEVNISATNGHIACEHSVLIVDDDRETRHLLRTLFLLEDFEIIGEAANGREAIAIAVDRHPDVIILDYTMPELNGEEAAAVLRDLIPRPKIVAFSAVLEGNADWADAAVNKEDVADLVPLVRRLTA